MIGVNDRLTQVTSTFLNRSQDALATSQERLASGKQVNSAADNAAGLSLISQFAARIASDGQGMRNLSDGISMMQTAEAGIAAIGDTLQRMGELSVQSRNGTLSDSDRAALQTEVSALREQVVQTIEGTAFNGIQPLKQDGGLTLQAGASDAIAIGTSDLQAQFSTLGLDSIDISTPAGATDALKVLDLSGDYLNEIRGEFGAAQNRLATAIDQLGQSEINSAASRSGIEDANVARETAERTRNMILSQTNTAMLSQANDNSSQFVRALLA